jgi:hypothetical protein
LRKKKDVSAYMLSNASLDTILTNLERCLRPKQTACLKESITGSQRESKTKNNAICCNIPAMKKEFFDMPIRGIEDPQYLARFFSEKGHPFFVIKISDVMDMLQSDQIDLLHFLKQLGHSVPSNEMSLRNRIQRIGFQGYASLSITDICNALEMKDLIKLQEWVAAYREVRQGKYEPSKIDDCDCKGKVPKCKKCEGTGKISVLLEVSEIEEKLAQGVSWEEINV